MTYLPELSPVIFTGDEIQEALLTLEREIEERKKGGFGLHPPKFIRWRTACHSRRDVVSTRAFYPRVNETERQFLNKSFEDLSFLAFLLRT